MKDCLESMRCLCSFGEHFHVAYQYPEEERNFEGILEEDKMKQVEDNSGSMKPKVFIRRIDN